MSLLGKIVSNIVKYWNPEGCELEKDFRDNLKGFLENRGFHVDSPYGLRNKRLDMVVNQQICIELKRDFDSSKYHTLVGQIEVYSNSNLSALIALICGVKNEDSWKDLKRRYSKGLTSNGSQVCLIRKESSRGKTEVWPRKGSGRGASSVWDALEETSKDIWGQ